MNSRIFSLADQIHFAQRLSILLNSGISLVDGLEMIRKIENSIGKKNMLGEIVNSIQHGLSLSKSIRNQNLRFNSLLLILIENGEQNGTLSDSLLQAYNYLYKKSELKKKIVSALVYPIFIFIATIFMSLFLILYIFPKIVPLLSSLDIELPLMTRIVQEIYYLMTEFGIYALVSGLVLGVLLRILILKSTTVKYKFDLLILSIPIVHKYTKINMMIPICSMGEMLLNSGRGIQELLVFARDSNSNSVLKNTFNRVYAESLNGIALSISLDRSKLYIPSLMIDMVSIGEKTGNLGALFGHTARIFEQEIENVLKSFTSLIEPVLMVFMGLVVGSIALSIILPVYEISNHLSK